MLGEWLTHQITMERNLSDDRGKHDRNDCDRSDTIDDEYADNTIKYPKNGPILSPMITQSQPVTPRLVVSSSFRHYMLEFTMHMNGYEHPYGMPTSVMASLHNSASTWPNSDYVLSIARVGIGCQQSWSNYPTPRNKIFCPANVHFYYKFCGSVKATNGRKQP